MDRLTISPPRGLIDYWYALSYHLFITSGLQKGIDILFSILCKKSNKNSIVLLNRNQEDMPYS